jgi:hypothetical protein
LALASVVSTDNTALLQGMEDLSRKVAALSAEQERLRASFRDHRLSPRNPSSSSREPHPGSRNLRPGSRSPPKGHRTLTLLEPSPLRRPSATVYSGLRLPPAGKLAQQNHRRQMSALQRQAASSLLTNLLNSDPGGHGFNLCVYPRRLIPRRWERTNYDVCAADGSTIHTYG